MAFPTARERLVGRPLDGGNAHRRDHRWAVKPLRRWATSDSREEAREAAGRQQDGRTPRIVSLFVEGRFGRDDSGAWAAVERSAGAAGWTRYAWPDTSLRLVARGQRRMGTGVAPLGAAATLAPLPYYVGVRGLASALPRLSVAVAREVARADTIILRLPGAIGMLAACACRLLRREYAIELFGDSVAVLECGALGRWGRFLAPVAGQQTRWAVRNASAALYETQTALQRRYPPRRDVPAAGVSSVRLGEAGFTDRARSWRPGPVRIVAVGSQEVPYKGHDVLLRAIQLLRSDGMAVTAVIVGGGRIHASLVDLATELGVANAVTFTGAIHDSALVTANLDQASLFVMPSRTEALPRALLEAMARALPAIASSVGGIPELLSESCQVPVGDHVTLAARIAALAGDPAEWEAQSRRNLHVARGYRSAILDARFGDWLNKVPAARQRNPR